MRFMLLTFALIACPLAPASSDDASEAAQSDLNSVQRTVLDSLDGDERAKLTGLELVAVASPDPYFVRAVRSSQETRVEVGTEFMRHMYGVAEALYIAQNYRREGDFFAGYARYLARAPAFVDFLQASRIAMLKPSQQQALNAPQAQKVITAYYSSLVAFVLGHEFGHHVLGHLRSRMASLKDSRRRETEADAFSLKLLKRLNIVPIVPAAAMLYFYYADEYLRSTRATPTHPTSLQRVRTMLTSSRDSLALYDAFWSSQHNTNGTNKADVERSIDEALSWVNGQEKLAEHREDLSWLTNAALHGDDLVPKFIAQHVLGMKYLSMIPDASPQQRQKLRGIAALFLFAVASDETLRIYDVYSWADANYQASELLQDEAVFDHVRAKVNHLKNGSREALVEQLYERAKSVGYRMASLGAR